MVKAIVWTSTDIESLEEILWKEVGTRMTMYVN